MEVQRPRVLWVDDDPHILASLERLFRGSTFEFVGVSSADEGLQLAEAESFPVIVSDQKMPGMTGIEFLHQVRQLQPLSTRVLVTAFSDEGLIQEAVNRSGVFRFFNKPWDPTELLHDLQICIFHSQQAEEQKKLLHEIARKKKELENLTGALAESVEEKAKRIDLEMGSVEEKRARTRGIIRFVRDVARLSSLNELMVLLRREVRTIPRSADPLILLKRSSGNFEIIYFRGLQVVSRMGQLEWEADSQSTFYDRGLSAELARCLGRPFGKIAVTSGSFGAMALEHDVAEGSRAALLNFLADRQRVLSIAVDRLARLEEARLAASDWERTFATHRDPIAIVQKDFRLVRSNRGVRSGQVFCHRILMNNPSPCDGCPIQEDTGKSEVSEIRAKDRTYKVYSFPIPHGEKGDSEKFVHAYVDITEERSLQSKLLQAEKMTALGLLSNSVSHELNNPLTGIRSMAQVLVAEETEATQFKKDLEEVEMAAERCEQIIKSFRDFALGEVETSFEKISLQEVVSTTIPFLKTSLRHHRWDVEAPPEPVWVLGHRNLLQQVVFNLVHNASQAMKEPGEIRLIIENKDRVAVLRVKDTGPGISEVALPHIFEPFFTTKTGGQGTGLGLKVTQSIVKRHMGDIGVQSEIGKGTEFRVEIPRA